MGGLAGSLAAVEHGSHPRAEADVALRILALAPANVNEAKLGVTHGLQVKVLPL